MSVLGVFKSLITDLIINPIEDIIAPGSRTSRQLKKDIKNALEVSIGIQNSKIIIFSDFHRGAKDENVDRFQSNQTVYKEALEYYNKNKYSLVLLGDIEEGWGVNNKMKTIFDTYLQIMDIEKQFFIDDRYYRVYGNHDDYWRKKENVDKFFNDDPELIKISKKVNVYPCIVLKDGDKKIILVHGQQGHNFRQSNDDLARFIVHAKFSLKVKSVKKAIEMRKKIRKQEFRILSWADPKDYLVVMGHTHSIYFGSFPVYEYEESQVKKLKLQLSKNPKDEKKKEIENEVLYWQTLINESKNTITQIESKFTGLKPGVFNAGNCCVGNKEISGIEIESGEIRLVFWEEGKKEPDIKHRAKLKDLFEN